MNEILSTLIIVMMQDILLKTKPLPAQQIVTTISKALLIRFISDNVQSALFCELKTENGEVDYL